MSNNNENNNKVWNRSLDDIMSESFGKYAKYIIQDRALPDIRDGLKPVQRRILYAMNELKINYDKAYKKSARTVGEVIGKYHPHGDSSIYEAMVRMAQEWKNNIPLLDMQGNKGSIDGDGPAAMRYTECRLSKFGQYMMQNIDKDTVKFIPNFDDSENEPSVLPSLLPNILINGATGIAAGYATNIPPFNFVEVMDGIVYRINNPESELSTLSKIIKGPDFPTGGIIQGKKGIEDIFKTGKGKFFVRAKIEEEITRSNKKTKRLIVKEIPFETNKAAIVKSLDEIRVNNELPGFKEVRDDSDKSGISIVLEFETEKDLDIIKTFLFKKTQLQISYTANMVLIKDRKPVQAGLLEILDSFIVHANEIVIKAATFDLNKALSRKEILEGLIKAISDIDTLVNLIKSSTSKDEAKQKVQDYFNVNERQSEAIVSLRLYVLTSYDTNKLKNEYEELLKFIEEKQSLINSKEHRNKHIITILEEFKKELGSKRRSLIEDQVEDLEIETADIVEEIKGTCIVTKDNYIKFINDDKIEEFELSKTKIKESDIPVDMFKMSTLDYLVCLTNKGKCITIPAYKIKMTKLRENGVHINDLITIDSFEKTLCAFAISKNSNVDTEILVATKNSLIKRMLIQDFNLAKNAKSSSYINLKNGDEVASACLLNKDCKEVISITENGYATRYSIDEIPIVGRTASGVKNMSLKVRDLVALTIPVPKDESFLLISSNRGGKRIHINDVVQTTRSKLGKRIFQQVESNPYVVNWGTIVSGRSTIYILSDKNQLVETKVSDIPISEASSRMSAFSKVEGNIIRGTHLDINKNVIETSDSNNFNTMALLKEKTKIIEESKKDENKKLKVKSTSPTNIDIDKTVSEVKNIEVKKDVDSLENESNLFDTLDEGETYLNTKGTDNINITNLDESNDEETLKDNALTTDNSDLLDEIDTEEEQEDIIEDNDTNKIVDEVENNNESELNDDNDKEDLNKKEEAKIKTLLNDNLNDQTINDVEQQPLDNQNENDIEEEPLDNQDTDDIEEEPLDNQTEDYIEKEPLDDENSDNVEEQPLDNQDDGDVEKEPIDFKNENMELDSRQEFLDNTVDSKNDDGVLEEDSMINSDGFVRLNPVDKILDKIAEDFSDSNEFNKNSKIIQEDKNDQKDIIYNENIDSDENVNDDDKIDEENIIFNENFEQDENLDEDDKEEQNDVIFNENIGNDENIKNNDINDQKDIIYNENIDSDENVKKQDKKDHENIIYNEDIELKNSNINNKGFININLNNDDSLNKTEKRKDDFDISFNENFVDKNLYKNKEKSNSNLNDITESFNLNNEYDINKLNEKYGLEEDEDFEESNDNDEYDSNNTIVDNTKENAKSNNAELSVDNINEMEELEEFKIKADSSIEDDEYGDEDYFDK